MYICIYSRLWLYMQWIYNDYTLYNSYRSECHGPEKYHLTVSRAPLLKVLISLTFCICTLISIYTLRCSLVMQLYVCTVRVHEKALPPCSE